MQIGAIGYPSYIYNTNRLNAVSLNRVKAIPEDALQSRIDYRDADSQAENTNPLGRGESKDLAGILASQMAMSRMNAARIMQPVVPERDQVQETLVAERGVDANAAEVLTT